MVTERHDPGRRRVLRLATYGLSAVGVGFAATPFVLSMLPSERARAAGGPVTVDIDKLAPGQMITVSWRGKPVWILRRSPEMLASLSEARRFLVDPDSRVESQQPPYARNPHRAIRPEIFVAVGLCTHLGCVPDERFEPGEASGLGADWPGGFFCPCHGSKFDLAGRVWKNVPAPTNLVIPPYRFPVDGQVEIGVDPADA